MKRQHIVLLLLALGIVGAEAAKTFAPPRTAVVDMSEIFENYAKKLTRQEQLSKQQDTLRVQAQELDDRRRQLVEEVKLQVPGPGLREKKLELYTLELQMEELKESELGRLQSQYVEYLQEMRTEITQEIKQYARAQDIDLVLEKTVVVETGANAPGFQWPIVHFAKPEINITAEITERLNRRFRNP